MYNKCSVLESYPKATLLPPVPGKLSSIKPVPSAKKLMFSNSGAGEGSLRSLGLQGDEHSQSQKKSTLYIPWKDWCLSWSSNTLATWCEDTTHWKRPWCWERLRTGGERDTEDEIVAWHHWLNGHEFEQIPEYSKGKDNLVCCSPWGCKSWTWLSDWTELNESTGFS